MRETGFAWWIERIKGNIALMDIIRIDHFVGFAHFWAVPAGEKTAIRGEWRHAPGQELFAAVEAAGLRPACLIYCTDLECDRYPDAPPYPVLWVAPESARNRPPFGEVLELSAA